MIGGKIGKRTRSFEARHKQNKVLKRRANLSDKYL